MLPGKPEEENSPQQQGEERRNQIEAEVLAQLFAHLLNIARSAAISTSGC